MSRSFKSNVRSKNDVRDQNRWNHLFRIKERMNLRSFGFDASCIPLCPGCETCDEWPNYDWGAGYITIHKFDVHSRHGKKQHWAGHKKLK